MVQYHKNLTVETAVSQDLVSQFSECEEEEGLLGLEVALNA